MTYTPGDIVYFVPTNEQRGQLERNGVPSGHDAYTAIVSYIALGADPIPDRYSVHVFANSPIITFFDNVHSDSLTSRPGSTHHEVETETT